MLVPNRHSRDDYRYGFQGQEKDDEIKGGKGNSLNYTFRMHDPRVGRFFAVDPLFKEYPELTPFQFSSNSPIDMVEIEGMEGGWIVENGAAIYKPGPVLNVFDDESAARRAASMGIKTPKELKSAEKSWQDFLARVPKVQKEHGEIRSNNAEDIMNANPNLYPGGKFAVGGGIGAGMQEVAADAIGAGIVKKIGQGFKIFKAFKQSKLVLRSVEFVDASIINKAYTKAPYDASVQIVEGVTQNKEILVRVHGANNKVRPWMMKASEIEGLTAKQIQDKFAIPELPEYVSTVELPKGTKIREGKAARVEGWGDGGGTQIEVIGERVDESWFTSTEKIE